MRIFQNIFSNILNSEHTISSLNDDYVKISTPFDTNSSFEGELFLIMIYYQKNTG